MTPQFVLLRDSGGRALAVRIDLIESVQEVSPDIAVKESRTGCVKLFTQEAASMDDLRPHPYSERWVIGTVHDVLRAIDCASGGQTNG